jgi:hypothetical protein
MNFQNEKFFKVYRRKWINIKAYSHGISIYWRQKILEDFREIKHDIYEGSSSRSASESSKATPNHLQSKQDTVLYTCNPSTLEAEAGGSQVPSQCELYSETLSQMCICTHFICIYVYTYILQWSNSLKILKKQYFQLRILI